MTGIYDCEATISCAAIKSRDCRLTRLIRVAAAARAAKPEEEEEEVVRTCIILKPEASTDSTDASNLCIHPYVDSGLLRSEIQQKTSTT